MSVINERMRFETFNDFFIRRKIIKDLFVKSTQNGKEIYKYYVYSNRLLSEEKADCIWQYLVEPENSFCKVGDHNLRRYFKKGGGVVEHRRGNTEENTRYGVLDKKG